MQRFVHRNRFSNKPLLRQLIPCQCPGQEIYITVVIGAGLSRVWTMEVDF